VPPEWHDVTLYFTELRLHGAYGLTNWLAIDLLWSLRVVVQRFVLEDAATRAPIAPPFGTELHHRNETLVGLTDPWLSLRAAQQLGPWSFAFRAGLTLPVGRTVPNPFALARAGKVHEHIQFGTGTVDPLAEVELRRAIGRFTVSADALAKASLYQNPNGYRAGGQLAVALRAWSDLWTKRLNFMLGLTLHNEQPETWEGLEESEGNLGRTDLLLDTSISVRLPRAVYLSLAARLPVFTVAAGEQLATPAILEMGVTRSFDLTRK
jgi:hypothetical protein